MLTKVMDVRKVIEECRIEIQAASEVGFFTNRRVGIHPNGGG